MPANRVGSFIRGAAAVLLMAAVRAEAAEPGELRVTWGDHNAPPAAVAEGGELVGGIVKDVCDALGARLGLRIRYVKLPRARIQHALSDGEVDAWPYANPAWLSSVAGFTVPYFVERNVVYVAAARPFAVAGPASLAGKRLGTIRGYVYPEIQAQLDSGAIIRDDAGDHLINLRRLLLGRLDAVIASDAQAVYVAKRNGLEGSFVEAWSGSRNEVSMAVGPMSPVSPARIDAALKAMIADGTVARILAKYR